MKKIWEAFRGRGRLHVVFWGYCIVGGLSAAALPGLVAESLYDRGFPIWFFIMLALAQGFYLLWAHVSVWMCAFNSSRRLWGYAARTYVLVAVAALTAYAFFPPFPTRA